MYKKALVLVYLACAVHGRRVQFFNSRGGKYKVASRQTRENAESIPRQLSVFAQLLCEVNQASAFHHAGHPSFIGAGPLCRQSPLEQRSALHMSDDLKPSQSTKLQNDLEEPLAQQSEDSTALERQRPFNMVGSALQDFRSMMLNCAVTLGLGLALSLGPPPLGADVAFAEPAAIAKTVNAMVQSRAAELPNTGSGPLFPTSQLVAAAEIGSEATEAGRGYVFLSGFPFPLGPFFERRTVQTELVKDRVYSFEQQIKLSGITANVRSTVFRMRDNHLLVYNPVAPTKEFLAQLKSLNHAGVSHILLGATQYEHKVFVGPFARRFPDAKVWAVPDQWSFPLNLPEEDFGIFAKESGGGDLVDTAKGSTAYTNAPDLTAEFEVKLLHPEEKLAFGYAANEAALFHKDTQTLTLTDALVKIVDKPPAIYDDRDLLDIGDNQRDSFSLGNIILKATGAVNWQGTGSREIDGFYAKTDAQGSPSAQLQRGWERNALLSLFFGPSPGTIVDPDPTFKKLEGKWIVAPVTNTLIYSSDKVKPDLKRWIEDVTKWDFKYISPSHFAAGPGTPDDLREAFAPTFSSSEPKAEPRPYAGKDVKLLDDLSSGLKSIGII